MGPFLVSRDEMERRIAEAVAEEGARSGELFQALEDLYRNGRLGDHSHWDREGNAGRTCPVCMDQRKAGQDAKAVLIRHAAAIRARGEKP